jgi:hypothetical protein
MSKKRGKIQVDTLKITSSNVIKNLKASPLLTPGINASMYAAV